MDIGRELESLRRRIEAVERQSRLGSASIDDTSIAVHDGDGSLRALVGQQADGTTAVNVVNGPPPPAPSAPLVVSVLGGVSVTWDGQFADSQVVPLDWSRVEIHTSTSSGFTPVPATLMSTIETPQGATVIVPTDDPVYVRLLARSTSGTPSTATAEVGPHGPADVVADDIIDGIVTTTKLAADAVTAAKIAANAVGNTEIADDAVTTAKVIAGAILAGKIATGAVETDKLAADAVTAAKIAALAVTTGKLDANAVTTAKLAAGSVDATALKADAITGKTITGGVINGAEFHSDDGAGGLVDIEDGALTATSSDGWKMLFDPTDVYPVLGWLLPGGGTAAAINGNLQDDLPGLNLSCGPFTDGAVTDWRWTTYMGEFSGGTNSWRTRRVRHSDTSIFLGGQLYASNDRASLSYINSADASTNNFLEVFSTQAKLTGGRFQVAPVASDLACFWANAPAGHTGMLYRGDVNGVSTFVVTPAGQISTIGGLTLGDTTWTTYTPTVAGHGSGTFTSRTGYYYKLGKLVYFTAEFVMNAAGTGSSTVTITAPSNIYRTTRQAFPCHSQSTNTSGAVMNGHAVALTTGSGAVIDRISVSNDGSTNRDTILQGSFLLAGATVTISGWYREA